MEDAEADYRRLQGEDDMVQIPRHLVNHKVMTADEARKSQMKRFDSDISLNFDTELEANLKFLDNLLGENSIHSHNTSEILD